MEMNSLECFLKQFNELALYYIEVVDNKSESYNNLDDILLQQRLMSEDYGKHLMSVEDLLQKHSLLEADIHVLGERVKTVNTQADRFVQGDFSEVGGTCPVEIN